jgi:hypothetical protein
MNDNIEEFCDRDNAKMVGVQAIVACVNQNPSRRGGTFISNPDPIIAKHGLINVDNSTKIGKSAKQAAEADNLCFKYAVCAARFRHLLSKKMRRPQLSESAL